MTSKLGGLATSPMRTRGELEGAALVVAVAVAVGVGVGVGVAVAVAVEVEVGVCADAHPIAPTTAAP